MGSRAAVVGVVAVVVVAGGAVVADRWALATTQERVAEAVSEGVDGVRGEPDVDIAGFPFLTQLAAGSLDDVTVTADAATFDGIELEDVRVRAGGVSTEEPYTATTAELVGTLPVSGLTALVADRTDLAGVDLDVDGEHVTATARVLGIDLTARLVPRPAGREIEVDVDSVDLAGATVDVGDLPQGLSRRLTGLTFAVDALPEGVELTDVTVTRDGVQLTAAGTDVTLPQD